MSNLVANFYLLTKEEYGLLLFLLLSKGPVYSSNLKPIPEISYLALFAETLLITPLFVGATVTGRSKPYQVKQL